DVVLAGPDDGVLRLAERSSARLGGLELGDGRVPGLQGAGDQVLGDRGYVVGVVDGLDALPRELERRLHGVRSCITGGHAGIDGQERQSAQDDDPLSGPASEGPHAFPPELRDCCNWEARLAAPLRGVAMRRGYGVASKLDPATPRNTCARISPR